MNCINKNHPEFKELQNASGINPEVLTAKIAAWQIENNVNIFPNLEELIPSKKGNIETTKKIDKANIETFTKEFHSILEKLGISVKVFRSLEKKYGIDAMGVADIVNKTIALKDGEASMEELTEEVAHFIIESLDPNDAVLKRSIELAKDTQLYKDKYSQYMAQYKDESKVAKEILGQLLRDELMSQKDMQKKSSLARLFHTIWSKVTNLFNSELKTFLRQHASNILNSRLEEYSKDNLTKSDTYFALNELDMDELDTLIKESKDVITTSNKVLLDMYTSEKLRENAFNKSNTSESAKYQSEERRKKLEDLITTDKGLSAYAHFIKSSHKDLSGIQNRIKKLLDNPDAKTNAEISKLLNAIDKYIGPTAEILGDIQYDLEIVTSEADLTAEQKQLVFHMRDSITKIKNAIDFAHRTKQKLGKEIITDRLMPLVASSGLTREDINALLEESEDITFYEKHLNSMAYASDKIIQLSKRMIDKQLFKAEKKHDNYITKLRLLADKYNIKSFDKFFQKAEGLMTGYFIANYDYGTFNKARTKKHIELNEKYELSNERGDQFKNKRTLESWKTSKDSKLRKKYRSYNTELYNWYNKHTQTHPDALKIMEAKQKKFFDEIVTEKENPDIIAKQIDEAQTMYLNWKESVIRRSKNESNLGAEIGYKGELQVPSDIYKTNDLAKLSVGEREFYDALIEIKQEVDSKLHVKTDTYLAPQVLKDYHDRMVHSKTVTGKIKQFGKVIKDKIVVTEDETEMRINETYTDASGKVHKFLPIFFNKLLGKGDSKFINDNLSTDLLSTISAYIDMGTRYEALDEVNGEINLITDQLQDRLIIDKSKKSALDYATQGVRSILGQKEPEGVTVDKGGKAADAIKSYFDMMVYREIKVDHGNWNIMGTQVNKTKLADLLNEYTAIRGLALNLHSGTANMLLGNTLIRQESIAREHFKKGSLAYADKIYWANIGASLQDMEGVALKHKLNLFIEQFDLLQDYEQRVGDQKGNRSKATKLFSLDRLFQLQSAGEHQMQMRTALAIAKDVTLYVNGKEVNLWEAFEARDGKLIPIGELTTDKEGKNKWILEEQGFEYSSKVHRLNQKLHGIYNLKDRALMQRSAGGRILTLFRKYLVPSINRRYGKSKYDFALDKQTEGMYISLFKMVNDVRKDFKNYKLHWENLSDHQKANVKRSATELLQLLGTAVLIGLISANFDDGDDEDNVILQSAAVALNRLYTELGAMTPTFAAIGETLKLIKSPAAGLSSVDGITKIFTDSFNYLGLFTGEDFFIKYDRGEHADEYKVLRNLYRAVPLYKNIENIQNPGNILKYY